MSGNLRYTVDEAGCWLWDGHMDRNGYGQVWDRERKKLGWAHRVSYEMHKGPLLPDHEIDHECQVTRCINPAHLAQVTRSEHHRRTYERMGKNDLHAAAARLRASRLTYREIADVLGYAGMGSAKSAVQSAVAKGLIAPDDVPPRRTLTEDENEDIRALYALGIPQTVIGRFYEVDSTQVSRICGAKPSRPRRAA